MTELKIKKHGDGLIINIIPSLVERFGYKEGDWVDIDFNKVIKLKSLKK